MKSMVMLVLAVVRTWPHRLSHALGFAPVTREHGRVGSVAYSWDLCDECGELSGGLAHDLETGDFWIPGPRELRHNVRLSYELREDA